MLSSLILSLLVLVAGNLFPAVSTFIKNTVGAIDFGTLLLKGMLGPLLFAGAIHIDAQSLKRQLLQILTLAFVGTIISTVVVAISLYLIFPILHAHIDFIYCLLFAALISPTDPVAVLAILKGKGLPKTLELKIAGESLFNDGVAVVIFISVLEIAQAGVDKMTGGGIALLFVREALGGCLFGATLGWLGYRILRTIDSYQVEVLITIALVMGGYMAAGALHTSGPLAMVVMGIILGNKAGRVASPVTREYMAKFWELVDEILNAILFLLIGFEMLVIKTDSTVFITGLVGIAVVLAARWVSVALPVAVMRIWQRVERNAVAILTWGGLRGGLSVALALALPENMHRNEIVEITYVIVIFSIVVQGLTIGKLSKRLETRK
jgi:CPA1 family monovalent cation:H+ antiporter